MKLFHENEGNPEGNRVFLVRRIEDLPIDPFLPSEKEYIREKIEDKRNLVVFYRLSYLEFVMVLPEKDDAEGLEAGRKLGDDLWGMLKNERNRNLTVIDVTAGEKMTLAVTEGLVLGSYTFANYKVKEKNEVKTIGEIRILSMLISAQAMERFQGLMKAVIKARDLVNEPVISLNTPALAESFRQMAAEAGMQAEVFGKKKIEALRMGGLLGVNKGSIDDPAFIILEWNPENAVNEKPVVIVGKGVVYDTGGMNIKTGSYMDDMKSDMAGAAAAGSAIYAAALARLPLHIIALIPATDNRVDGNAVVSGDVLTLYNGTTVEVLNTDAEGRLILADALAYANQYQPKIVIDLATLTGAAARAIGKYASVAMHCAAEDDFARLKCAGDHVCERIVEFPLWDDYQELLKSEIADIRNISTGTEGGAITAGKFLQYFTNYPYIHIDIAGTAFTTSRYNYRGLGATGVGVRLLFNYFLSYL